MADEMGGKDGWKIEKCYLLDNTREVADIIHGDFFIARSNVADEKYSSLSGEQDVYKRQRWNIKVHYSKLTGEWNVEGKSYDRGNLKAYNTYGTKRVNAYKIIEDTLNMKDVRVFDYMEDDEGKKKAVLNKKETAIAQSKQELIKQGFQDWVWRDPCLLYTSRCV